MHIIVVTIKDRKANAFGQPLFYATEGLAYRAFDDAVNGGNEAITKHPGDYELYKIATYNDEDGHFVNETKPKLLADGANLAKGA